MSQPPNEAQQTCEPTVHEDPAPHATKLVGGGGGAESFPASFCPPELPLDDGGGEPLDPELPASEGPELEPFEGVGSPSAGAGCVGAELFEGPKRSVPVAPLHAATTLTSRADGKKRRSFIE